MSQGMVRSEGLHVRGLVQVVSALEAVVLRSFGPDGGLVLFTRDTGQVLLTRHGTRIITALRLDNPLARMVVECVRKHSSATGDGSKTFILLLASLLRTIQSHRGAETGAAAGRLAEELLAFGLEELPGVIAAGVVPHCSALSPRRDATNTLILRSLVGGFLRTRLGHAHSDVINQLTCELLSQWICHDGGLLSPALRFIDDNFPALHTAVSGFPIGRSHLLEGQVIHRDFSTPHPPADHQPIRALVVTEALQPDVLTGGAVLKLDGIGGGGGGLVTWAQVRLEGVFVTLLGLGVTLLLSSVKQSEAVLARARWAGVCVVECVCEDELALCCRLSGAEPVSDWSVIERENVADLTFCQPILLGGHRCVHMGFPSSANKDTFRPHSLVLCGPADGQTEQSVSALRDAVRMLLTALEPINRTEPTASETTLRTTQTPTGWGSSETDVLGPGRVVTVGGTFEWLLHHALLQSHASTSAVLAKALLSVPRQIYSRSPRQYLQAQMRVLGRFNSLGGSRMVGTAMESGSTEKGLGCVSGLGTESVTCKYQLILAVLQCVRSLLRIDTVLHTCTPARSPAHTHSHRHSNTPRQISEEEDGVC